MWQPWPPTCPKSARQFSARRANGWKCVQTSARRASSQPASVSEHPAAPPDPSASSGRMVAPLRHSREKQPPRWTSDWPKNARLPSIGPAASSGGSRLPVYRAFGHATHLRRAALSHSEVLGSLPQLLSGQQQGPAVEKRRSQRHWPIAELSGPDVRAGLPPSGNREPGPGTPAPHTDVAGRQWAKSGTPLMGRKREGGWNY